MRILFIFLALASFNYAQDKPQNGVATSKPDYILLKNAEIIVSPTKTISKGCILIKDDKIVEVGTSISSPKNCVEIDCEGKTIVPAFIELNSSLGMPTSIHPKEKNEYSLQMNSSKSENYSWNEAIHPEFEAGLNFGYDKEGALKLEKMGFGFALSHLRDGIVRGSSVLVSTNASNTRYILKNQVGSHFSFDKGSSHQSYPSSQMGSIALLRQTFYDLEWYEKQENTTPNISLDALAKQTSIPLFFETEDAQEIARA